MINLRRKFDKFKIKIFDCFKNSSFAIFSHFSDNFSSHQTQKYLSIQLRNFHDREILNEDEKLSENRRQKKILCERKKIFPLPSLQINSTQNIFFFLSLNFQRKKSLLRKYFQFETIWQERKEDWMVDKSIWSLFNHSMILKNFFMRSKGF